MLWNIVNKRDVESRLRDSSGFGTIQLVVYIAVSAIIALIIGTIIYTMMVGGKSVGDERSQTSAVQSALQEISRTIDESATVFRATETELGIGRNTPAETSAGGIDCTVDQFWVADDGAGGSELRQWQDVTPGACSDTPSWSATSGITGQSVVMVSDLMPYTLVDDTGLASAACTATASEGERSGAGYCVPLFRYLDSVGAEFTPATPVAKNSISVVRIVMTAGFEGNPVPVSRSKDVSPDNYVPNNSIGEVIAPTCPATLNRTLSGSNVTLSWAPVPNATQYRIIRTYDGTTSTRATLLTSSLPSAANPSYTDSISGLNATSVVYQVLPTVSGQEASGCPQAIVSIQVTAPDVTVDIIGSNGTASWRGQRSNDNVSGYPSIEASWTSVPGASGYEAELREMNPGSHTPITGWAPFSYNGTASTNNLVNGTTVNTDTWNGSRLFSRSFQVRVRATSDSGSSPWTYCYMQSGDGNAGSCGQFPGNSFPDTGRDGYLVMPAPGVIQVTDVTRSYSSGNTALTWGESPTWSAAQYNRENNQFYRIERDTRNGTDTSVSYADADYSVINTKTTSTSGSSSVAAGDWADFRMIRCNYRNPYSSSGGTEQCGPKSRIWSALGLPGVPGLNISVDSTANQNTVRWGKNAATTTTDYTNQRVNYYDVAEQQGGGSGTSQASGNTSSYDDTVNGTAKTSPWLNNTTSTSATHNRREGDFTRYSTRSCNTSIKDGANIAGVTAEAGQGTGVESCSDWRGDSNRYWQTVAVPSCTATDDWNTITVTLNSNTVGGIYISPLNTVTEREVGRRNLTEDVGWWRTLSGSNRSYSWNDDGYSGNSSEGTVRPETQYRGYGRITTSQAGTGQNSNCNEGWVNYPPVPQAPYVNVSYIGMSTSFGTPNVRYEWDADDSPVASNYVIRSTNGGSWSSTSNSGSFTSGATWKTSPSISVRAAHTSRLAGWGYTVTNSDSSYLDPAARTSTPNGCPGYAAAGAGTSFYSWYPSNPTRGEWSGNGCEVRIFAGQAYRDGLIGHYAWLLNTTECPTLSSAGQPLPPYCSDNTYSQQIEAANRADASPYTTQGNTIGTLRFTFGVSTLGSPGYTWSSGPNVYYPTTGPASHGGYPPYFEATYCGNVISGYLTCG